MLRLLIPLFFAAFACAVAKPAGGASAVDPIPVPASALPFTPVFTLIHRSDDPQIALRPASVSGVPYNTPTWRVPSAKASRVRIQRDPTQAGDGFDDRILDGAMQDRAYDLFAAGDAITLAAIDARPGPDGRVRYDFPDNPVADLVADYVPPGPGGFPALEITLTRKQAGWISLGYTGAPAVPDADAEEGWQPLIWTERRFPALPYLTSGHMTTLPGSFVRAGGVTYGVVADPVELPFQPLPLFENVRFGVALRTTDGRLRPMVFAPMLGGAASRGTAGETFTFTYRLVAEPVDIPHAFEAVARRLFGFADLRHNALGSLDETLANVVAYAKSDYARFDDALKGCAYSTDVPGAVKNVSSLDPLGLALATDDSFLFGRRARPILEYLLSREKFLFSLDPKQKIQSPSRALTGPSAPLSEFASWAVATDDASAVYRDTALSLFDTTRVLNLDEPTRGDTWWNALSLYEATHDPRWLARARAGADAYIAARVAQPATRFVDPDSQGFFFWPGFTPRWIDLLRLHAATGDRRYLEAAHRGARLYTLFTFMCPAVPAADITVNVGGHAPVYWYLGKRGFPAIPVPEGSVPAWRLSEIGLTPESSGTASGHRAIFMASYAPWMLRLAALTDDTFLRDIARWAIIGRSRNFPGYHMNTARTTVYEKAGYPLRPHAELSYNSMHYNHILPMGSMLLDYLVDDAWALSGGAVDFPGAYIEGYAYLQSQLFGYAPGRVYDLHGLQLWMPPGLVQPGSPELNFISAAGDGKFAVVLTNQSDHSVHTFVRLDSARFIRAPATGSPVRLWIDNQPAADTTWRDGGVDLDVPARGIAAFAVTGAEPRFAFRSAFQPGPLNTGPAVAVSPGDARAMLLSVGPDRTWAYIYLREDDSKWSSVHLIARVGNRTIDLRDDAFPFEFDFDLPDGADQVSATLEATTVDGRVVTGQPFVLPRSAAAPSSRR